MIVWKLRRAFLPTKLEMLSLGHAFQVAEGIVVDIAIPVMDVALRMAFPKNSDPYIEMQVTPTSRKIAATRPLAVESAVKILGEGVKHDWITEPLWRCAADIHPSAVLNKCSAVHLTVYPSLNATSTSGACLRVIRGL
jgi:DNA-binding transcriptional regulator YdaS (Cro superfamily)